VLLGDRAGIHRELRRERTEQEVDVVLGDETLSEAGDPVGVALVVVVDNLDVVTLVTDLDAAVLVVDPAGGPGRS
jgi:hypothetical protein